VVKAHAVGEALARQEAAKAHDSFDASRLQWLYYMPATGAYMYGFTTSGDVPDAGGASRLIFDGDTGALKNVALASKVPAANRFTDWIVSLHMASVWGGVEDRHQPDRHHGDDAEHHRRGDLDEEALGPRLSPPSRRQARRGHPASPQAA
jgi:hypothetical protein